MYKEGFTINIKQIKLPSLRLFSQRMFFSKALFLLPLLCAVTYYGYYVIYQNHLKQQQTFEIVSAPQVNDIYFFDFRVFKDDLRPTEKYRLAKVVDITGDIVTLVYGSFYYQRQHAAINSIYYGQLSYKDYFEAKRFDYKHSEIQDKLTSGAIYLAMRPVQEKLLGQRIGPEPVLYRASIFIQGRKENLKGEAFLNELHSETNLQQAFEQFSQSASYGYAQGQVNLAEMYINGLYIEKDLVQALYWLNLASLQSNKKAILKYDIVCKQVASCQIYDFFENLVALGVDVKVRQLDTNIR